MASAARAHTATLECASCTLRLAGSALVPRSRKNRAAPRGLSQDRHQRVRFGSKHVTPTRVGAAPRVQHSHVKVVNSDAARRWPRPSATQRGCYAMATEDKSICVTGATGFVGKRLVQMLVERGYRVKVLTRDVNRAKALVQSNKKGALSYAGVSDWDRAVRGSYGVVNLAGEPISTRWTETIKREIMDSRVKATRKIVEAIAACPAHERPQVFVSSSAVGYYGTSMNNRYTETSQPGNDYLAEVCKRWEATALSLNGVADDVRIVIVRIGVVLDQDGGALAKMLPIFQMFAGGALGSGKQWFSWVHRCASSPHNAVDLTSMSDVRLLCPAAPQG
eukprot:scaffold1809_cov386-Prasinococcus_capsulatus_cf.AAC.59